MNNTEGNNLQPTGMNDSHWWDVPGEEADAGAGGRSEVVLWARAGGSSSVWRWTGERGSSLMQTGMRGTLAERTGEVSAGAGLGAVGGSPWGEDSTGREGMVGSASSASIFSSLRLTGGASALPGRAEQRFTVFGSSDLHSELWSCYLASPSAARSSCSSEYPSLQSSSETHRKQEASAAAHWSTKKGGSSTSLHNHPVLAV